jgi:hypothetical protein
MEGDRGWHQSIWNAMKNEKWKAHSEPISNQSWSGNEKA